MRHVLSVLALLISVSSAAAAQFIELKTLPVASGEQFTLFPAQTFGMGGVTIAVDDPLHDPFDNPARGSRLQGARLLASPTFFDVSGDNGGARTIPVTLMGGAGDWFAGGAVALQHYAFPQRFQGITFLRPEVLDLAPGFILSQERLSDQSARNLYAFGLLGTQLSGGKVAVGSSMFLADLNGVDGVELLYGLAQDIDQFGHLADFRVGVTADLSGDRTLDVVALHSRFNMTHDVTYLDWVVVDSTIWQVEPRTRVETNLDRTNTWGLHVEYVQPLTAEWRIGGTLTANVKSHPKIPNYELMNIPRDPGTSWAYNIGVGLAREAGPATFAFDVVYEPIRSHTWAEAESPTPTAAGDTIAIGGRTVDNRFRFSNAYVRFGAARDIGIVSLSLGLAVRSIDYTLNQRDLVANASRRQGEHWMEWTPTWGASLRFPEFEIRYVGRVTTGTGRPGLAWGGPVAQATDLARAADIIAAPAGPLTLQDAHVMTHQVAVSMPIR